MQRYKSVIHLTQLMGHSYQDDQITNDVIMPARTEGWCWMRGIIQFTQWMFWYNIVTLKQKTIFGRSRHDGYLNKNWEFLLNSISTM